MILQALSNYYDALARRGEVTPPGWSMAKVSFALDLDGQGALRGLIPLKVMPEGGSREIPQSLPVPEQVKKSSGIASNFLCENSSYFLGIDSKGNPDRTGKCFAAAAELHNKILSGADSPAARAVCGFFDTWQPDLASEHPALTPYLEELLSGANLIFSVNGEYPQNDPAVRGAWEIYRAESSADAPFGLCLVSGKHAPIARLHPSIRGVQDAQSSGASLVSFNAAAFESYGHELANGTGQGLNSPVSEDVCFRYGTALNRLIADGRHRQHTQYIGDTTIVYWAEDAEPLCQDVFAYALYGDSSEKITDSDLESAVRALARGDPVDVNGIPLSPDNHFYVLGLSPSAARLSVRFFLQDTFGRMLSNVQAHYRRLSIVRPVYNGSAPLSLRMMLRETVNPNSQNPRPSPPMAGAVVRAILSGGSYPVSLLEQTMLRTRAEHNVTYGRAAILKAFFLKNTEFKIPEEVLQVELNEQCNYPPYVLGRLFAVLEKVQTTANFGINATIKDKYFNSACATPATIFPLLTKLSQSHLRKLEGGTRIYYEKLIGDLEGRIRETLPARMSLADQGTFHLGYYHQVQKFFEKKEKGGNENV